MAWHRRGALETVPVSGRGISPRAMFARAEPIAAAPDTAAAAALLGLFVKGGAAFHELFDEFLRGKRRGHCRVFMGKGHERKVSH